MIDIESNQVFTFFYGTSNRDDGRYGIELNCKNLIYKPTTISLKVLILWFHIPDQFYLLLDQIN